MSRGESGCGLGLSASQPSGRNLELNPCKFLTFRARNRILRLNRSFDPHVNPQLQLCRLRRDVVRVISQLAKAHTSIFSAFCFRLPRRGKKPASTLVNSIKFISGIKRAPFAHCFDAFSQKAPQRMMEFQIIKKGARSGGR